MTYFTNSPFERMMMQRPESAQMDNFRPVAPKGHHCYGCSRYGEPCLLPCHRDLLKSTKKDKEPHKPET